MKGKILVTGGTGYIGSHTVVELQQSMAASKSVIMDGRDIGTVVLPDAELKYFITASAEERASRRYKELMEKGQDVSYDSILSGKRDTGQADDAVLLDTTMMTAEEVVNRICTDAGKML